MGANLYAIRTKIYTRKFSQDRTPMQKFLVTVWRMTPYLALFTNIALTILELRVNRMKALVGLTVTVVTLVLPQSFVRYLNPGIRLPMDFIALYYGSNRNRFTIILGWTQIPFIRNSIKAQLAPLLPSQLLNLL